VIFGIGVALRSCSSLVRNAYANPARRCQTGACARLRVRLAAHAFARPHSVSQDCSCPEPDEEASR